MDDSDEKNAFESAVSRLPYPVFVVDERNRVRPMNGAATALASAEGLDTALLDLFPSHPLARAIVRLRNQEHQQDDSVQIALTRGGMYELIHSYPSARGAHRWLMLMLRPLKERNAVDLQSIRKRWPLTSREAEIAARCIAGHSTSDICEQLSISRETFKSHMTSILGKSGCETRAQLAAQYFLGESPGS